MEKIVDAPLDRVESVIETKMVEPRLSGVYGDYNNQNYLQRLDRLDWASDTLKYLRRNKDAKLMPATVQDISSYAEQIFCDRLINLHYDAAADAMARRMNNIMGSLTEYGLRSGDINQKDVSLLPCYNQAKQLALSLFPEEQTCSWGNQLLVFETIFNNYPKHQQQFIVDRSLDPGRQNYIPAAIEEFCWQASTVKPSAVDYGRYAAVRSQLAELGFVIAGEVNYPAIVRLKDGAKLKTLESVASNSDSASRSVGGLAIIYSLNGQAA